METADKANLVDELRRLIVDVAPEAEGVDAVLSCPPEQPLDELMRFSSLAVLGVVVAIEDRYAIHVKRNDIEPALKTGASLASLAGMVHRLRGGAAR